MRSRESAATEKEQGSERSELTLEEITPLTDSLTGIVKGEYNMDEEKTERLSAKYQ